MTETQWIITVVASFLGGGAMGAIINSFVTKYRSRRQPVGYNIDIIDVFKVSPDYQSLEVRYTKKSEELEGIVYSRDVEYLSIARITLINKGNQDIQEFKFGVTMEGTNQAVDIKLSTFDRHHVAELSTPFDLRQPAKEFDLTLKPFNRGDSYTVDVYFTYEVCAGQIILSTPHSTKFVQLGYPQEFTNDLAKKAIRRAFRNTE